MARVATSFAINDQDFAFVSSKGNKAEWLRNQLFLHLEEYGDLPPLSQILKPSRTHAVFLEFSEQQQDKLRENARQYGIEWKDRARRVTAQIIVDAQKRLVSTAKESGDILISLNRYRATIEPNEADLIEAIDYLADLIQKREAKSRYKRMIPEIQQLMQRGFSLDDIVNVAQTMKEVSGH